MTNSSSKSPKEKSKIQVLLVDDNPDDTRLVEEVFTGCSHIELLAIARNGADAMDYLKRSPPTNADAPDLVLLDINMPRMNGFEMLQEVKANPELRQLPIVMFSTSSNPNDIRESYLLGACSYLCKPVGFIELERLMLDFERYWVEVSRLPPN